ncbi:hypothetical protein [Thalassotalea marina]|uniref:Uncharacterized protein n=1 Tax=Thalassotalea marina TaxID=1673741 RepID=A0A919EQD9_9GAMM|nr:hypothetical protein [Thalassotalea marina]GHG07200.1 hypothetical protein GCM10017161_41160 [Thalassotalea marina]
MTDSSKVANEIIDLLEARFSKDVNPNEKVLQSLLFASTLALLATKNENCSMIFDSYKATLRVEESRSNSLNHTLRKVFLSKGKSIRFYLPTFIGLSVVVTGFCLWCFY